MNWQNDPDLQICGYTLTIKSLMCKKIEGDFSFKG